MTPSQKSPAGSGRGITAVIARHTALSLDVCTEGKLAAIHVQTSAGVIVIIAELAEFVSKFRGPADHNGRSLPIYGAVIATVDVLERDAEAVPPPAITPEYCAPVPKRQRGEAMPLFAAAWEDYKADPSQRLKLVAARHNVRMGTMAAFFTRHHGAEYRALRAAAKRGLNHSEAAANGLPLTKPSGGL